MDKHLTLLILIFTFSSTANTAMAENLWDNNELPELPSGFILDKEHKSGVANAYRAEQDKIKADKAKKKAVARKESKELFNTVLTQGRIISQGYEKMMHSFVVIYKRKIYNCYSVRDMGECSEHSGPI